MIAAALLAAAAPPAGALAAVRLSLRCVGGKALHNNRRVAPLVDVDELAEGLADLRHAQDLVDEAPPHRDLSAPTPTETARQFEYRRKDALASTFQAINDSVANGRLSNVECRWSRRLRTTAGRTIMKTVKEVDESQRVAAIELSTHVIDSDGKLESTLAHELCHAAAWIIDGVHTPPHGHVFRSWADKVHAAFPHVVVGTRHRYFIAYKFRWRCSRSGCTYAVGRHSPSVDVDRHVCPRCSANLEVDDRRLEDLPWPSHRRLKRRPSL